MREQELFDEQARFFDDLVDEGFLVLPFFGQVVHWIRRSTGPRLTGSDARPRDSYRPSALRFGSMLDNETKGAAMAVDRPPYPPFTRETAAQKVQAAEDAWNTRDPERVASAYTVDSVWRNRDLFITGRDEIVAFLTQKWERELGYALRKNLWCFDGNRIAVRFQYESHDRDGRWWRSYGNELWEFEEHGLMRRREASINDVPIDERERRILGPREEEERGKEFPLR